MKKVYIGKIVNTHGLKGELRIISDFKYKKDVFDTNGSIYVNDKKYNISSYRVHKIYDMVTLEGINDINEASELKGFSVYINRDDYVFNGVLNEDLIGLDVYDGDIYKGKVIDIVKSNKYDLLVIDGIKRHMVPNISEFVKSIDLEKMKMNIKYIRGLDNED